MALADDDDDFFNVGSFDFQAVPQPFNLLGPSTALQSPQHAFYPARPSTVPQTLCQPRSIWGVPHPEQYDLTPSRLNWDHIEENVAHIAKKMRVQETHSRASLVPYEGDNDLLISDLFRSPSKNVHSNCQL